MKVTVNLPDALHRHVKVLAAEEGMTMTSVMELALTRLLREGVAERPSEAEPWTLPLLDGSGVLPGVDVTNNAAMADLLDRGSPLAKPYRC